MCNFSGCFDLSPCCLPVLPLCLHPNWSCFPPWGWFWGSFLLKEFFLPTIANCLLIGDHLIGGDFLSNTLGSRFQSFLYIQLVVSAGECSFKLKGQTWERYQSFHLTPRLKMNKCFFHKMSTCSFNVIILPSGSFSPHHECQSCAPGSGPSQPGSSGPPWAAAWLRPEQHQHVYLG